MDCKHAEQRMMRMTHCNQVRMQCMECGQAVGNAISHSKLTKEQVSSLPEFDYELRDLLEERRREIFRENAQRRAEEAKEKLQDRREAYYAYLKSPEWQQKRRMVIQREDGRCQGCRTKQIEEVHHISYDNIGDELLFELIGLCRECHKKAHKIKE